jgi:hypothetical protein
VDRQGEEGVLRHIYPDLVDDLPTIQEGDEVVQAAADIEDQPWISEADSTQEPDPARAAPRFSNEDSRWPDWETMRPQEEEIAAPWPQQSGEMNRTDPSPHRGRSRHRDADGHSR